CESLQKSGLSSRFLALEPYAPCACGWRTYGELPGPAAPFALGESREHGAAPVPLAEAPRGLRRAPSHRLHRRLRARHSPRREGTRRIGLPDEGAGTAAGLSVPRQAADADATRCRREARNSRRRPPRDVGRRHPCAALRRL